jgi:hypothetical protein
VIVGRIAAVALAALGLGVLPGAAAADTFKPTRFDDPVPGKCKPKDCSLREAMKAADDHPGHDDVVVRPGRYELELPGSGLYEGSLDLVQGVTVRAKGRRNPTIDANGLDQVITAWANLTSGESFEIRGLTLTGGVAGPVSANRGGAISTSSEDKFALAGVTIRGNSASQGGGVANHSSALTITNSKIRDNEAGQGGGIYLTLSGNSPSVVIRDSLVAGNEASFGGGVYSLSPELTILRSTIDGNAADEGGGLDLVSGPTAQPMTAIRSSTISGNSARKGGGILTDGNQPSPGQQTPVASLLNSTVALNHTSAEGGGIMADNAATVTLDQATIAYNTADDDNLNGGVAGGIYQHSGAIFSLADSIVAKNVVGSSGTAAQCEGTFEPSAGAVVEAQPTGTCTVPGSSFGVGDALIGTLGDNGGPTETIKLLAGSPAIGFSHEGCPKKDQRGVKRPAQDCDSGAFERKNP